MGFKTGLLVGAGLVWLGLWCMNAIIMNGEFYSCTCNRMTKNH